MDYRLSIKNALEIKHYCQEVDAEVELEVKLAVKVKLVKN